MNKLLPALALLATFWATNVLFAQAKSKPRRAPSTEVLSEKQWKQVDKSVRRGLQWLVTQQGKDGSFKTHERAQPAVTSFCVMAFLAQGESPADGQYQQQLAKAVDFIIDQQRPNGLIARVGPNAVPIPRNWYTIEGPENSNIPNRIAVTSVNNHAISALALCEAYGQCNAEQAKRMAPVIEKAIAATLEMQRWPGKATKNKNGWRYLTKRKEGDSDLSVTGWQLMFLRSARNAGFDVPTESIDGAVRYIENCFWKDRNRRVHVYLAGNRSKVTRSMAGAGILAMAHAGKHNSKEAIASGDCLLKYDFSKYDSEKAPYGRRADRYHYGAVLCTQGMYQLGGKYWEQFFPKLVDAFLANQMDDGSWLTGGLDKPYGGCYTTSLSILSLSVPNQLLPIFQR